MPTALMTSNSPVTHRDDVFRPLSQVVESEYDKSNLSKEEAHRLNMNGDKLKKLVRAFIAENRVKDRFKGQEVQPAYGYPKEYKGPKPIEEQIALLAKTFRVSPDQALAYVKNVLDKRLKADLAEGPFAMISPFAFGDYCETTQVVFGELSKSRKKVGDVFYNYREGQIVPERFRLSERTRKAYEQIAKEQPGPIWIIEAQLGKLHGGRSILRAVEDCFVESEFGLDAVAVASIAIVHPERFVRWEELDIDLPGTEIAPVQPGVFDCAASFWWLDGRLEFGYRYLDIARDVLGSGSGFLPPQAMPAE